MKIRVFAVWVGLISTLMGDDSCPLWVTVPAGSNQWRIILPAPPARRVYANSMSAVDIKTVICDGCAIKPEESVPMMGVVLSTVDVKSGSVVYQFSQGFFECWSDLKADPATTRMRRYEIPKNFGTIFVEYVVRYPDGSRSKCETVAFVASDQPIQTIAVSQIKTNDAQAAE